MGAWDGGEEEASSVCPKEPSTSGVGVEGVSEGPRPRRVRSCRTGTGEGVLTPILEPAGIRTQDSVASLALASPGSREAPGCAGLSDGPEESKAGGAGDCGAGDMYRAFRGGYRRRFQWGHRRSACLTQISESDRPSGPGVATAWPAPSSPSLT